MKPKSECTLAFEVIKELQLEILNIAKKGPDKKLLLFQVTDVFTRMINDIRKGHYMDEQFIRRNCCNVKAINLLAKLHDEAELLDQKDEILKLISKFIDEAEDKILTNTNKGKIIQ